VQNGEQKTNVLYAEDENHIDVDFVGFGELNKKTHTIRREGVRRSWP